ncbi:unnamed protein product [Ceutorhynchus assimilis]|uniref:PHD-type domain-containing protein n=1 Tax=Ceutorhynchus assimilis TaxID=467358 RepID=A0A9N9QN03_9CUCU|nr:unnamed protein product [Ceutorhynchus assimilis]
MGLQKEKVSCATNFLEAKKIPVCQLVRKIENYEFINDQLQNEHEVQEQSNVEGIILIDVTHDKPTDVTKIHETDQIVTEDLHFENKFQEHSNEKDTFADRDDNGIDITEIIDTENVSLLLGIPDEEIPIIFVNTPDKANHDAVFGDVLTENNDINQVQHTLNPNLAPEINVIGESISENSFLNSERNSQRMETTLVTTPTKVDSELKETNSTVLEKEMPLYQNVTDESIPTPFKKFLFWPTPKENIAKRKLKDKVPAVATSSQWQQYYNRKEEKKKQEEQLKMQRKEKRTIQKEIDVENKKKKVKIADLQPSIRRTSIRRVATKLQKAKRDLFSKKKSSARSASTDFPATEPSTSKPFEESWHCAICDTEDQLDMRLCSSCLKYFHENCVGLTEDDEDEFQCPFC